MAAVVKGARVRPVTPAGYEYYDKGTATEDILAGDLVKVGPSGVAKAAVNEVFPSGIALKPAIAGFLCEFGRDAEMDGFTGLTAGTRLYSSGTVAGGMDTTAVVGFLPRIEAVSTTRVAFRF